jgi:hypothetical protein
MKSERRHELQQNSLMQWLHDLPEWARQNSQKIALVVIFISLLVIWLKYRSNSAVDRLNEARLNLTEAMVSLRQLQALAVVSPEMSDAASQQRELWYTDGLHHCDDAMDEAGDNDAAIHAQALITKGDLNFALADMPDIPGAATRPSLRPDLSKFELLSNAQAAYSKVLSDNADNEYAATAARLGLAAVAEDLAGAGTNPDPSQWDVAKQQYQAVMDDPNSSQAYKDYASNRLEMLSTLQQPPAINVPALAAHVSPLGPAIKPTTR